jgi:hypothetical protein
VGNCGLALALNWRRVLFRVRGVANSAVAIDAESPSKDHGGSNSCTMGNTIHVDGARDWAAR